MPGLASLTQRSLLSTPKSPSAQVIWACWIYKYLMLSFVDWMLKIFNTNMWEQDSLMYFPNIEHLQKSLLPYYYILHHLRGHMPGFLFFFFFSYAFKKTFIFNHARYDLLTLSCFSTEHSTVMSSLFYVFSNLSHIVPSLFPPSHFFFFFLNCVPFSTKPGWESKL